MMKNSVFAAILTAFCNISPFASAQELDGFWMSDGYGIVAEVKNGKARAYQFAGDICVPDGSQWERLPKFLDGIKIALQPDGQTALIKAPYAQHRIRVHRIPALPAACHFPLENTPLGNFEAFAAFFSRNYAFFDLYGVNWKTMVAAARARIRADMSDTELFQVMVNLMAPLKDGHLELNGREGRKKLTFEPNRGRTHLSMAAKAKRTGQNREDVVDDFHRSFWKGNVQNRILQGAGTLAGNKRIQFGIVDGDIGYLALVTVAGYSGKRPDPKRDLRVVNKVMDEAIQKFQEAGARAVIIDLSVNYGGFDFISRAIAERFAAKPTHAYTKYAGDAKNPIRTNVILTPNRGRRFEGPVFVMTSNVTISGGEILTLALRALPNVTHVGEPTRGALSDVLDRTLPNGWELSLSNEVYLDSEGIAWEGRGIEPHIAFPVLPDNDPIGGHWRAIKALLKRI
jgi:carboxyl-terminal processing protease